jgi:hypothetical protein
MLDAFVMCMERKIKLGINLKKNVFWYALYFVCMYGWANRSQAFWKHDLSIYAQVKCSSGSRNRILEIWHRTHGVMVNHEEGLSFHSKVSRCMTDTCSCWLDGTDYSLTDLCIFRKLTSSCKLQCRPHTPFRATQARLKKVTAETLTSDTKWNQQGFWAWFRWFNGPQSRSTPLRPRSTMLQTHQTQTQTNSLTDSKETYIDTLL